MLGNRVFYTFIRRRNSEHYFRCLYNWYSCGKPSCVALYGVEIRNRARRTPNISFPAGLTVFDFTQYASGGFHQR